MAKFKNNEERKAFLESYKNWNVELDIPEICEKIYRYDLSNGTAIAAREVKRRAVESWWKKDGEEFYYIVSYYLIEIDREDMLFSDCKKSMTEIIDYLRLIKE